MSRTAHHVRWKHWNVKRTVSDWEKPWTGRFGVIRYEETLGNVLNDLRFYAGCKGTPQPVTFQRWYYRYSQAWGHNGGVAKNYANKHRSQTRAEERAYAREILKAHRSDGDLDEALEPEGRTRHRAIWEAI